MTYLALTSHWSWVGGVILAMIILAYCPKEPQAETLISLPAPAYPGTVTVAEAIKKRRTIRRFANKPLSLEQVGQLLWAADGVTDPRGLRSAPSAGALYPLDVYLVAGEQQVAGLAAGVYHYLPEKHSLSSRQSGDRRRAVAGACLQQTWLAEAPILFVITGEYRRSQVKYGNRGVRYILMEVGHVAQNIFLQAEALNLGAGIVGAFEDTALSQTLTLPMSHEPLVVMPVGYR